MITVTVLDNQSLIDIAIQHTGTATSCFDIAMLNNLSLTDELTAGSLLQVRQVENPEVVQYIESILANPATALTVEDLIILDDDGACCLCDMFKEGDPIYQPEYT